MTEKPSGPLRHLGADLSAGLVVFLVAVPLCLGIAQASGAPLLSGLIAGVIGGCVVAAISSSSLSVSGPAAGLAVIVANGIASLGFRTFLLSVMLGGALQIVMGVTRLGGIAHYFPSSVIKGMLAAIGVLIILKQIPHSVGYDHDFEGDESLFQPDGENTFSALMESPGSSMIFRLALILLVTFSMVQSLLKEWSLSCSVAWQLRLKCMTFLLLSNWKNNRRTSNNTLT
jgi:MFS superfamily sulfate permease-like transporter